MGRITNSARFFFRWLPWITSGAAAGFSKLPEKSKEEIKEITKEPSNWGRSIEKAWDSTKIGSEHFKKTSGILANILIGRKVSKSERIEARDDLATLSIIVPPLRVFMIPGSQVLLGIMARVTPWRLIPDDWIPISALKKVREGPLENLQSEASFVRRLLKK